MMGLECAVSVCAVGVGDKRHRLGAALLGHLNQHSSLIYTHTHLVASSLSNNSQFDPDDGIVVIMRFTSTKRQTERRYGGEGAGRNIAVGGKRWLLSCARLQQRERPAGKNS